MFPRPQHKKPVKGEYLETDTGNIISRRAKILGTPHIILSGRVVIQHSVCLRGDIVKPITPSTDPKDKNRTSITIGRYSYLSNNVTLHPPFLSGRGGEISFIPMTIGSNVFIGEGTYVSAASIGSNVYIDSGCVIGNACVISDRVKVLEGSVMVAGMAVPTGVVVGGKPARILGDLPEGWGMIYGGVRDGEWVEGGDLKELIRSVHK